MTTTTATTSSKPTDRTLWMFPRNIRRIEPWKLVQITKLLMSNTGDVQSQQVQDALYRQLHQLGVKVEANELGVANSGGMRTYFAQLACLGFFWKNPNTGDYEPTRAGETLLQGNDPLRILRCQLCRMQYPSVYGLGPNVRVSPELNVKPFVFLIGLFRDPRLEGRLTCEEMAVPVIYGRTHGDHDRCVEKILAMRAGATLRAVIDDLKDLRTPKRYHPDDPDRDWTTGLEDAVNIANTAKNYMQAAQLVVPSALQKDAFELNDAPDVTAMIAPWLKEPLEPLNPAASAAWQQRFGRFDQTKVVRRTKSAQVNGFASFIQVDFIQEAQKSPYGLDRADYVKQAARKWGYPEADIERCLQPMYAQQANMERNAVLQAAYSGGRDAIVLEQAAANIFRKIGFDLAAHIGQKKANRQGGYPDVYLRASDWDMCAFIDTKATSKYDFALGDAVKLKTYYKDAWTEFTDPVDAAFFTYVAGGFKFSTEKIRQKLRDCSADFGRPVSAMTVYALLDLAEMQTKPTREQIVKALSACEFYASGASIVST